MDSDRLERMKGNTAKGWHFNSKLSMNYCTSIVVGYIYEYGLQTRITQSRPQTQ